MIDGVPFGVNKFRCEARRKTGLTIYIDCNYNSYR